ncbi:transposase [uncultured Desulfobacter sp.]|uniref:transposase n=1 Tax=uncultured Desulfobacter sp. TaxID=240139 RepID=UPI003749B0AF
MNCARQARLSPGHAGLTTKLLCKYHVVWIPKYRRKELYGKKRQIVVDTIKQWALVLLT